MTRIDFINTSFCARDKAVFNGEVYKIIGVDFSIFRIYIEKGERKFWVSGVEIEHKPYKP